MIYVLEMIVGDDFDNITSFTRIFKIGYTENFNRRVKDYHICNPFFKVFKVFTGAEFDHACEKRLHYYLADKKFDGRAEMFYKDDEVVSLLNSIQTRDDIMNLYSKLKHRSFKPYYNRFRDLINRNWGLIKKVYTGSPESLVNEMLHDSQKDIVSYVKSRLGVSMVDYTEKEKGLINKFFDEYNKVEGREGRLKFVCEYGLTDDELSIIAPMLPQKGFYDYLTIIGPKKCKACGYRLTTLDNIISVRGFDPSIVEGKVVSTFELGKAYTKAEIKSTLANLYKEIGYKATAKASDLFKYFKLRTTSVFNGSKRVAGFKLLEKIKEGDKNEA